MVTVIPGETGWADAFRNIGGGLVQGYTQRSDENAIREAVAQLPPDANARQILDTLTNVKTYSPAAKQQAFQNYLGVKNFEEMQKKAKETSEYNKAEQNIRKIKAETESKKIETAKEKEETERQNTKALVEQLDLPEEQKKILGETLSYNKAQDLLMQQLKPAKAEPLTPFEKKVQTANAEEYIELSKDLPILRDQEKNIERARKMSQEITGLENLRSKAGLSGKYKDLEATSLALIKPIVKIFNPSGPIAQAKLELIKNNFAIKPWDIESVREAKLNVLKLFNDQAIRRAEERLELFKKYDNNPPKEIMDAFDKESDSLSDAMIDYDFKAEEAKAEGLPQAKEFKGQTITSPDGQDYYSDGTRWIKR